MATTELIYIDTATGSWGPAHTLVCVPIDSDLMEETVEELGNMSDSQINEWGADQANTPTIDNAIYALVPVKVTGVGSVAEAEQQIAEALDFWNSKKYGGEDGMTEAIFPTNVML